MKFRKDGFCFQALAFSGEDGIIVKAFGKVRPKNNAKQMLKELI